MKNNINNEEFDSIDASIQSLENDFRIMESIASDVADEAISYLETLPMHSTFRLEDIIPNDTLEYIKSRSSIANLEEALIQRSIILHDCDSISRLTVKEYMIVKI